MVVEAILASLFLSFSSAVACTYSSFPQELGRDFSIEVSDRGRPVAGLQIELSTNPSEDREIRSVKVVTTDASGVATFSGVKPGNYFVGIKQAAFRQNTEIRVLKSAKPGNSEMVHFDWPGRQVLSTKAVSGVLNGDVSTGNLVNDLKPPLPHRVVAGARLTLAALASGDVVASRITAEDGTFDFGSVPSGRYSLRVEKPSQSTVRWHYPDGYLFIEVDSASESASLDILLSSAICGELGYRNFALSPSVEEAKMPIGLGLGEVDCSTETVKPNLFLDRSTHVTGTIEDESGASFSKSKVVVRQFDAGSNLKEIKIVATDDVGRLDLGTLDAGRYRVLASPNRAFAQAEKLDCGDQPECKIRITLRTNRTDLPYAACPIK